MEKKKKSSFFVRRLHSLLGLVPIGIFMCLHLVLNSGAFGGAVEYVNTIEFMRGMPFIIVMELALIAAPIIFHAFYGIYIVYLSGNNVLRYKYLRNWFYLLQRVTAIIVTIFVLFHVLTLRILTESSVDVVATFAAYLQNPLIFVLYAIGVIASVYHFANGLFTLLITWGVIQGPRAQKIFQGITIAIFALMSIWAVCILVSIANISFFSLF